MGSNPVGRFVTAMARKRRVLAIGASLAAATVVIATLPVIHQAVAAADVQPAHGGASWKTGAFIRSAEVTPRFAGSAPMTHATPQPVRKAVPVHAPGAPIAVSLAATGFAEQLQVEFTPGAWNGNEVGDVTWHWSGADGRSGTLQVLSETESGVTGLVNGAANGQRQTIDVWGVAETTAIGDRTTSENDAQPWGIPGAAGGAPAPTCTGTVSADGATITWEWDLRTWKNGMESNEVYVDVTSPEGEIIATQFYARGQGEHGTLTTERPASGALFELYEPLSPAEPVLPDNPLYNDYGDFWDYYACVISVGDAG